MVPVFVVVILAIALGIAIVAIIMCAVDAHEGWAAHKKAKDEAQLRAEAYEADGKKYRKVLGHLRDLLPAAYAILGESWDYEYAGWDSELLADTVREKDRKDDGKTTRQILKALEPFQK